MRISELTRVFTRLLWEVDEYHNNVYKDICNPITSEFQQEFSGSIIKAYEMKKDGSLDKDGLEVGMAGQSLTFNVRVTPYEQEGSNIRGFASIYLDDSFVVSNVSIINGRNGEFVSMPAYKAAKVKAGESAYRDIVYPITKEFREKLFGEILNVYHEKKQEKAQKVSDHVKSANVQAWDKAENTPFR